jgi:hypothetical protein
VKFLIRSAATAIWLCSCLPSAEAATHQGTFQPILPDGTYGAKFGAGIECVAYGQRNAEPPANYAVHDIGRPGVPTLKPSDLAVVRRIQHYLKSPHLRFTWVIPHQFIVYDAVDGLCNMNSLGYPVLNQRCNDYYEPGQDPTQMNPAMTCTKESLSRPWMNSGREDD